MFATEMTPNGPALVAWHHSVSDMRVPGRAPLCRDTVIDGVPLFVHTNSEDWFGGNEKAGITAITYKILLSPDLEHVQIKWEDQYEYARYFTIKDPDRDDSGFIITGYGETQRVIFGTDMVTLLDGPDTGETIIINPDVIIDIQEIRK